MFFLYVSEIQDQEIQALFHLTLLASVMHSKVGFIHRCPSLKILYSASFWVILSPGAFSSLTRIFGECLTIHSLPVLFYYFFNGD